MFTTKGPPESPLHESCPAIPPAQITDVNALSTSVSHVCWLVKGSWTAFKFGEGSSAFDVVAPNPLANVATFDWYKLVLDGDAKVTGWIVEVKVIGSTLKSAISILFCSFTFDHVGWMMICWTAHLLVVENNWFVVFAE